MKIIGLILVMAQLGAGDSPLADLDISVKRLSKHVSNNKRQKQELSSLLRHAKKMTLVADFPEEMTAHQMKVTLKNLKAFDPSKAAAEVSEALEGTQQMHHDGSVWGKRLSPSAQVWLASVALDFARDRPNKLPELGPMSFDSIQNQDILQELPEFIGRVFEQDIVPAELLRLSVENLLKVLQIQKHLTSVVTFSRKAEFQKSYWEIHLSFQNNSSDILRFSPLGLLSVERMGDVVSVPVKSKEKDFVLLPPGAGTGMIFTTFGLDKEVFQTLNEAWKEAAPRSRMVFEDTEGLILRSNIVPFSEHRISARLKALGTSRMIFQP